jgi:hypothetical protein
MKPYIATLLLAVPLVAAAQQEAPSWKLSGYGTVGAVHSNNDQADYLVDAFKPNGPGYTRSWSTDVDTRLGLQLAGQITSTLSAVVQVLSQQSSQDSYRPGLEWANVRWQPTPEFSVRAGRVVLPVFMVTDTRRVGYANPWVRPPVEMYAMVPVTHSDGVDASYRMQVGDFANTLQGTAGTSKSDFPAAAGFGSGTANVHRLYAANDTLEFGAATFRVSGGQADLAIAAYQPLTDALNAFGPVGQDLAQRWIPIGKHVTYVGLGASYDPGRWFAMAEWGRFDTRSLLGTKVAWYVSGGYRFGKVTPYATYAQARADSPTSIAGLPVAAFPPAVQPTAAFVNNYLSQQIALIPRQSTLSLGARWDFAKNAALKAQYDWVDLAAGSTGTFGHVQPGFAPGGRVGLLSVAVDFVF